ncbi:TPA: hypothetical protein N0F65_012662 [Lagenidium giganteum]|uniref:Coronin n=1 Tax=Lagenidium giganteum TaxID=4803 RepID=A0AAV2YPZ9_9STRA|nr:TPA: hypothetical protein N0F65_012662 [Lagenidium giganteum]
MAPRFRFQTSKFRNVECKPSARGQCYDQLQVTSALFDGNIIAATVDKFAFAHQKDGGAAIQVKQVSDVGKDATSTPPLLRGHQNKVNALEFSPYNPSVLASASADGTVKLWHLPENGKMEEDISEAATTLNDINAPASGLRFHPSASDVLAVHAQQDLLVFDLLQSQAWWRASCLSVITSTTWNYNGSVLLASSQDRQVRMFDPRAASSPTTEVEAHAGRRNVNVVWCGSLDCFLTTGSDQMQERELKFWDVRNLGQTLHRERLDSGIGQLYPLYDADVNLLYVLGKGDRSVRCFEVDPTRSPVVTSLDHSVLGNMTMAATMLPKQACDTNECEIARILNLSSSNGGICEVLSFQVPRKDAINEFQSDLYPDTLKMSPAMSSSEWQAGQNSNPLLERVSPTPRPVDDGGNAVFGAGGVHRPAAASGWGASSWNASQSSTATTSGVAPPPPSWGAVTKVQTWASSGASSWGAPATSAPSTASTAGPGTTDRFSTNSSVPQLKTWATASTEPAASVAAVANEAPASEGSTNAGVNGNGSDDDELSDKAKRLGAIYGHKMKYIKGKQGNRNDVFNLGDKTIATSGIPSPLITANSKYWAVPVNGGGGPVLVNTLDGKGKASLESSIVNGHKATVTDTAFSPFHDDLLVTGSGDAAIHVWTLGIDSSGSVAVPTSPSQSLESHTKGIRSLHFHPAADNVLASSAYDLSIRLWDVEYGKEQTCLAGKLEDIVWNMEFNWDGGLLACTSRDRVLRVFDPRSQHHALGAIGCGHESNKPQFMTWVSSTNLVTGGLSARNERQLSMWDCRSLVEPLSSTIVDSSASSSAHYPFFDESSSVLFLVALGERAITSYEIDNKAAANATFANANLPFQLAGQDSIAGASLLPKRLCNVREVEVDQMLVLTQKTVERLSFSLPRTDKLKQYFQDDVFGPVRCNTPALSGAQWFAGEACTPEYTTLRPSDMVALSEKPEDTVVARPKAVDFRNRMRQEEAEKRQKDEQIARLTALAHQPSLHGQYQPPPPSKADCVPSDPSLLQMVADDRVHELTQIVELQQVELARLRAQTRTQTRSGDQDTTRCTVHPIPVFESTTKLAAGEQEYEKLCIQLHAVRREVIEKDLLLRAAEAQRRTSEGDKKQRRRQLREYHEAVQRLERERYQQEQAKLDAIEKAATALEQLQVAEAASQRLEARVQSLQLELQFRQGALTKVEAAHAPCSKQQLELTVRVNALMQSIEYLHKENERLQNAMRSLEQNGQSDQKEHTELVMLKDDNNQLRKQIGDLNDELRRTRAYVTQQARELETAQTALQQHQAGAVAESSEHKQHIAQLLQRHVELEIYTKQVLDNQRATQEAAQRQKEGLQMQQEEMAAWWQQYRQHARTVHDLEARLLSGSRGHQAFVSKFHAVDQHRRVLISELGMSRKRLLRLQQSLNDLDNRFRHWTKAVAHSRTRQLRVGKVIREYGKQNRELRDALESTKTQLDAMRRCVRQSEKRKTQAVQQAASMKSGLVIAACQREAILAHCKDLEACLLACQEAALSTQNRLLLVEEENDVLHQTTDQLYSFTHEVVQAQKALERELKELEITGKSEPFVFG